MSFNPRDWGAKCSSCPLKSREPIKPKVNTNASLVILGESPARNEEIRKEFFVGKSGQLVREIRNKFDIPFEKIHFTNAILCRPTQGMTAEEWTQALNCCHPRLDYELKQLSTTTILGYGLKALWSITGKKDGIFNWMGAPMYGKVFKKGKLWKATKRKPDPDETCLDFTKYRILPTVHPAFCLRTPQYTPILQTHTLRAWRMANNELPEWVWPELHIKPPGTVEALKRIYETNDPVAVDVETLVGDPLTVPLKNVGVSTTSIAVSVQWDFKTDEEVYWLKKVLESNVTKVMHNMQFDILVLEAHGFIINGDYFDTMLALAVISSRIRKDLGTAACIEFHADRWKDKYKDDAGKKVKDQFDRADPDSRAKYNCKDCIITVMLMYRYTKQLDKIHNGWEQFNSFIQGALIAMKMRKRGVEVNLPALTVQDVKLTLWKAMAKKKCVDLATKLNYKDFNPDNNHHLRALYKDNIKVESTKMTDAGKTSYDAEALVKLATHPNENASSMARVMLDYREVQKAKSTNIDGIIKVMDENNLIRASWNPTGAVTGRWASKKPNLMNVPKSLRNIFKARDGNWIVEADKSQLELRILGALAKDKPLLDCYANNGDVHDNNARDIFNIPPDQPVPENIRVLAKTAVYCSNYGGTYQTLWEQIVVKVPGFPLADAKRMLESWYAAHPDIEKFKKDRLRIAHQKGYVEDIISGKRFYFFGRVEPTIVANFPMQAGGAGIINPEMIAIADELNWESEGIMAQVHDSLVLEGPDPYRLYDLLKKYMERVITINGIEMNFPIDVKVGRVWGECVDVKSREHLEEIINKGK